MKRHLRLVDVKRLPVGIVLEVDGMCVVVTECTSKTYTIRSATPRERRFWRMKRWLSWMFVRYVMPRGAVRDLLVAAHRRPK